MNGASAALAISQIPVPTHVGAVRIGKLDGDFVVNPAEEDYEDLEMDLVVSGSSEAILMVECGAKGVTEAEVLDALDIAHEEIKKIVAAIEELRDKAGKEKIEVEEPKVDPELLERDPALARGQARRGDADPREACPPGCRQGGRGGGSRAVRRRRRGRRRSIPSSGPRSRAPSTQLEKDIIRRRIAIDKKRPDGRAQDEIRPIECEVDISPRVHGSALFTRGETQILSNVALGTTRMDMRVDNLGLVGVEDASGTTTTSRRSRSGRRASCAARSAATSATARSPSERSCRRSRARRTSPT